MTRQGPVQQEKLGDYRAIHRALIQSPEYLQLDPGHRLVLLTLKVLLGPLGLGMIYPGQLGYHTGLTPGEVDKAESQLVVRKWLRQSDQLYWLVNGLRFEPLLTITNPSHRKRLESLLAQLPKVQLVHDFRTYYGLHPGRGTATPPPTPPATPPPTPRADSEARPSHPHVAVAVAEAEAVAEAGRKELPATQLLWDFIGDSASIRLAWASLTPNQLHHFTLAVVAKWLPGGMLFKDWGELPQEERPRVLADVLVSFPYHKVEAGKTVDLQHFRGYLRRAVGSELRQADQTNQEEEEWAWMES